MCVCEREREKERTRTQSDKLKFLNLVCGGGVVSGIGIGGGVGGIGVGGGDGGRHSTWWQFLLCPKFLAPFWLPPIPLRCSSVSQSPFARDRIRTSDLA